MVPVDEQSQRHHVGAGNADDVLDPSAVATQSHRECPLSGCSVGVNVSHVVHDQDGGDQQPNGDRDRHHQRGDLLCLQPRRARNGDWTEEYKTRGIAEAMICQRKGAAGIRESGQNREHADEQDRPSANRYKIQSDQCGKREGDGRGGKNALRRYLAALGDTGGTKPLVRIGAALKVENIVGEVGTDLDQQGGQQGGYER